ncbi:MAG: DUF885 domain-containing protein [Planctomycetaceae bacterium]
MQKFLQLIPALLISVSLCTAKAAEMDPHFDELASRYIEEFTALSPVQATELGDHRYDSKLDDVSQQARDRKVRFCRSYLKQLTQIDRGKLSRQLQIDHELLEHDLSKTLWELTVLREWEWNPLMYTSLAGGAIYSLTARNFAPLEQRLSDAAARLEHFPEFYRQVRATLIPQRVPPVHAETAVKQNRGVLSILTNMVEPHLDSLPADQQARLQTAIASARAAVDEQQQWLEHTLVPQAAGNFRIGPALYDQKLKYTLQSDLSRDQIRARGESELHRVRTEMYEISRKVYATEYPLTEFPENPPEAFRQAIIRAALELAYAGVPGRDAIVATAEQSMKITTDFVRSRDLITIPDDPLEIIIMPEFQRGVSVAYCDSPGPLDVGQKTFYAVAPLPDDWSQAQCASFLREYNTLSIHNLTVHEAMPGHFLQLAFANRYPSRLRALLASGVFIEGWACYTEQMMSEAGFLDNDPLMRLITLKWYLRSIVNAILDQSVHVDGINREEAMRMMIEDAFQEEREAAGKWKRAQMTSVQLSTYFVGFQEHRDLRHAAEKAQGNKFSLRKYHDAVISHGSPPVRYVRSLLLED